MAQRVASFTPPPAAAVVGMPGAGGQYAAAGCAGAGQYAAAGQPQLQPFAPVVASPDPAFSAPQLRAQSFSAAPVAGAPGAAGAVQNMMAGLPNPDAIQKQKEGYVRLLDEQLKQGQLTLDQQRKQQTEYLYQQAQQQKQQVEMQVKQQVQQQEMQLLQQYNQQLMQVQQQSSQQKAALEQQAMLLTMEFQQKKSQEEMMAKQQQLQKDHVEAQMKFAAEMQKLQVPGGGCGGQF